MFASVLNSTEVIQLLREEMGAAHHDVEGNLTVLKEQMAVGLDIVLRLMVNVSRVVEDIRPIMNVVEHPEQHLRWLQMVLWLVIVGGLAAVVLPEVIVPGLTLTVLAFVADWRAGAWWDGGGGEWAHSWWRVMLFVLFAFVVVGMPACKVAGGIGRVRRVLRPRGTGRMMPQIAGRGLRRGRGPLRR